MGRADRPTLEAVMPFAPSSAKPAADLATLRAAVTARPAPAEAVEEHWVGEIAFALWQQGRLQAFAALALAAAESDTREPEPQAPATPESSPLAPAPLDTRESEAGLAPASRPLNRQVCRRLEALARKAAPPAA